RYADLWNVVGGPAAAAQKLEVLRAHCQTEGRDIGDIVKTAHAGIVVIDESDAGVRQRLEALSASPPPALRGLDADQIGQRLISGTPQQVSRRLRDYFEAGFDGITMSVRGVSELRPVELLGEAIRAALPQRVQG
ncbi:MAG: hypothetical protein J2P45_26825, partial [Candidatus Dormibacteraeota bacterium]|nr:hypothetical protein [Candidatus Dormibacteraeota bacterium]